MANEYDKILKESVREPKLNLLKQLLGIDTKYVRAAPPRIQQTIVEREADTALEVETIDGRKFLCHIEWQSTNDKSMALRMAKYDILLMESYECEVMGIVIYVGNKAMSMRGNIQSFGLHYECPVIDIRDVPPNVFLSSKDPGELILAILTGKEPERMIREILIKLQVLTKGDQVYFKEKVRHLEVLSQLRGNELQKQVIKEEENMPITLDIRQDLRFQEGVQEGRLLDAQKMIEEGLNLPLIQRITGLEMAKLQELKKQLEA
ncbi:hypothetical protein SAMN05421788_112223 [Filimonas lacunae]|uniref:Uncharacterized protein n=1 Tax=Filimonas lacunae TaxID=477680 RepID=A0A1N7REG4_9BACT|nr:hypothetical protein [Filimonas lacunae]SIT33540.1 hypothetical protein SAMN05421788_112223 [Filimonas lacunae]